MHAPEGCYCGAASFLQPPTQRLLASAAPAEQRSCSHPHRDLDHRPSFLFVSFVFQLLGNCPDQVCLKAAQANFFFFFSEQKGQKWLEGFMTKSPAPLTENVELLSLKVQDCISILLSLPLWTSVQLSQGRTTVSWAAAVMWIWSFWKGGGAWIVSQENSKSSSAIVPCLASPSFNSYCCFLLSTGSSL